MTELQDIFAAPDISTSETLLGLYLVSSGSSKAQPPSYRMKNTSLYELNGSCPQMGTTPLFLYLYNHLNNAVFQRDLVAVECEKHGFQYSLDNWNEGYFLYNRSEGRWLKIYGLGFERQVHIIS